MKYIVYILCSIMFVSGNAYAAGTKRPVSDTYKGTVQFWKNLNKMEKTVFLVAMQDGMRALCVIEKCTNDMWEYVQHNQIPCIMQEFDGIYDKDMTITPTRLFGLSLKKCNGELTEAQFLSRVKKYR